jgi:NTE family protein
MDKKNVALVLSGGGARGLAHIGVIEELLKNGYQITSLSGTSIGSVVAGVYVSGKLTEFKDWISHVGKFDVFKLMDFAISKNGFVKGEKVFNKMREFIEDVNIEDLDIPFAAVSVDIKNHKEIVFRTGKLIEAIRASVSVPTILKPMNYKGIELVDGGLLNPLPLDCIVRNPDDLLIAVDLNTDLPYQRPRIKKYPENHGSTYLKVKEMVNEKWSKFHKGDNNKGIGLFDLITESIYTMQMKLTQTALEKHKPDILVKISRNSCDIFEFHRAEELIEYGRMQVKMCFAKEHDKK